ncbi:2-phosphosulfolactate phosphatase [Pseudalkalibacillus sp. A8]|uniref:2-phosphosulfolactate phosphatase n=1 Tax=Pseudalkalibacillus sp. A8 TaxID=3382641 RepID=UPI0038B59FF1
MKIHLLLKKEEIDQEKMRDKVAVTFDILLATSTITAALEFGAREVIPVLNGIEAVEESQGREEGSFVLVGEYQGVTIEGFLSPNPKALKEKVDGKIVILSTTNGTVAIRRSNTAKAVYTSSLLNNQAVAEQILNHHPEETIVLVCAGSSGEFNVEDFYGAGHFIDRIAAWSDHPLELTDSAYAAHTFYQGNRHDGAEILKKARIGQMLLRYGFEEEINFVAQDNLFQVIPRFDQNSRIVGRKHLGVKK